MKPLSPEDLEYVATRAERAFIALRDARVVVTGASGFVGSWLAESAESQLNIPRPAVFRHTRAQNGDIRHTTLDDATHVIHCASAGSDHDNRHNGMDVVHMIQDGTRRVAEECARVGARLLLMSSGSVYQPHRNAWQLYGETDPLVTGAGSPAQAFALAKRRAEDEAIVTCENTVIARGFAMLGPRLPAQFAAAQFMERALGGEKLTVHGTGATVRSYLYAADVAAALWTLLAFGKAGHAYNVGSGTTCKIGTLACHVANQAGLDPEKDIRWGTRRHDSPPFVPNTQKFRDLVNGLLIPAQPLTAVDAVSRWLAWERS